MSIKLSFYEGICLIIYITKQCKAVTCRPCESGSLWNNLYRTLQRRNPSDPQKQKHTTVAVWSIAVPRLKGTGSVLLGFVRYIWGQLVRKASMWYMWEWSTRCTLFLIKLFHLNYPVHVSNKLMFISRRLFLYTHHILYYHASMGCPAANTMWLESHRVSG